MRLRGKKRDEKGFPQPTTRNQPGLCNRSTSSTTLSVGILCIGLPLGYLGGSGPEVGFAVAHTAHLRRASSKCVSSIDMRSLAGMGGTQACASSSDVNLLHQCNMLRSLTPYRAAGERRGELAFSADCDMKDRVGSQTLPSSRLSMALAHDPDSS